MVNKTASKGKSFFVCGECGFAYGTGKLAQKCEGWCRNHHSCNLKITRHAINLKQ